MDENIETGWLIEKRNGSVSFYFGCGPCAGKTQWTTTTFATRFARKQDATEMAHALGLDGEIVATEHEWS